MTVPNALWIAAVDEVESAARAVSALQSAIMHDERAGWLNTGDRQRLRVLADRLARDVDTLLTLKEASVHRESESKIPK